MYIAVMCGRISQAKCSPVDSGKKKRIKNASQRNGTMRAATTRVMGNIRSSAFISHSSEQSDHQYPCKDGCRAQDSRTTHGFLEKLPAQECADDHAHFPDR